MLIEMGKSRLDDIMEGRLGNNRIYLIFHFHFPD